MKRCVVIIPVYKEALDPEEVASIKNTQKTLYNYDIKIVCPEGLDTKNYSAIGDFDFIKLENKYFVDDWAYSKLLLSDYFYRLFENYEYMLICQADAWVFEDKLEDWCSKGYDYVGAPWFKGYGVASDKAGMVEYAGNGGFSLRNINSFIRVLSDAQSSNRRLKSFYQVYTKNGNLSGCNILKFPKAIFKYFSRDNILQYALKELKLHEDNVIVTCIRKLYPDFKVAKAVEAKYFAFEVNPRRLYKETDNTLPFGCHGFSRFDWDFWKNFIKI